MNLTWRCTIIAATIFVSSACFWEGGAEATLLSFDSRSFNCGAFGLSDLTVEKSKKEEREHERLQETSLSYLPIVQTDLSDLDARDAQNRPIFQPSAIGELAVIFRENASELLVRAAPFSIRSILASWNAISHLFNKGILIPLKRLLGWFEQAVLRPIRKVVHNVNNLWITLSDGSPVLSPVLQLKSLSRTPQQLFLRC